MNDNIQTIGYQPGDSFLYRLSGSSKLFFFAIVSVACMTTYDTRFLFFIACLSVVLFRFSGVKWRQVSFVIKFIAFFSLLNVLAVYIFDPAYGTKIFHSETILFGSGYFRLTAQELFYLINLVLKYICTVPLSVLFLLTTNPSKFASSLNKLGMPYKIAYAVSLALRYIPDIQDDFFSILRSQQARGFELSKKASFGKRIKGYTGVLLPLIFSSLARIDSVSVAMELRRFGKGKKRTWYAGEKLRKSDFATMIIAILLLVVALLLFKVNGGRFFNPFV